MSNFVCEKCGRETNISFTCQECYRGVCHKCIETTGAEQLCVDCNAKEKE